MTSLPYMPFFVDAYTLDAGHLTEEEHGAYLRLLMLAWASPECRLPNDDAWLARRLSRPLETIQRLYRPILAEFFQSDGNWLWQKRLRAEWERARKNAKVQSDNAKSRWKKEKKVSGGTAAGMPPHPHINIEESPPTPPPEPEPKAPEKPRRAKRDAARDVAREAEPEGFADFYKAYPRKMDRPKAAKAYGHATKIATPQEIAAGLEPWLRAWADRNEPQFTPYPASWLNSRGWQDVPPPRTATNGKHAPPPRGQRPQAGDDDPLGIDRFAVPFLTRPRMPPNELGAR